MNSPRQPLSSPVSSQPPADVNPSARRREEPTTLNPFSNSSHAGLVPDQVGCLLLDSPNTAFWQWLPAQHCNVALRGLTVDTRSQGLSSVPLKWKVPPAATFNTPNEAFYRGCLPEVLVLWLAPHQIAAFASGWVQWVESLSTLGYLLDSDVYGPLYLQGVHPKVVLMGDGLLHASLCNRLHWQLERLPLTTRQPAQLRAQVLASFCRGMLNGSMMRIGGVDEGLLRHVQGVFHRKCLAVSVAGEGSTAAERLEISQFSHELLTQWLPAALTTQGKPSAGSLPQVTESARTTLLDIGKVRQTLSPADLPGLSQSGKKAAVHAYKPGAAATATLQLLTGFMQHHGLTDHGGVFQWLLDGLEKT